MVQDKSPFVIVEKPTKKKVSAGLIRAPRLGLRWIEALFMSAGRQPEETEADGGLNASADVDWGRAQWLSAPNTKSGAELARDLA